MEIYQLTQNKESSLDFLKDIINESGVNAALDRDMLSIEILRQCGAREPRYNTTFAFKIFAINFFKTHADYINRTLDLMAIEYNPINTFSRTRDEKIDRIHTDDIDETRTNDLKTERTDDLKTERTDDLKSERTDDLTKTRTDNLTSTRTDNLTERKTGSYTDDHYVSAENETEVMLRTRDTHTETDAAGSGTLNTGTQTNADTGTQTTADSGTQTVEDTGTQTTENTGTQTLEDTGTVKTKAGNEYKHDDHIKTTESGYKTSPNEEFYKAIARNDFNIYEDITEKFAENMCLGVF